jgi:hypothetical protein
VSRLFKLIDEFSRHEIVPVEVDAIVDYLRTQGIKDEIYFWDAPLDIDVLKGTIVHWEYQQEGWTHRAADIYTAKTLSVEEKRLVRAKEILHILDHRSDQVNTLEDVQSLIEEMVLPESSIDPEKDSDHARSDRDAILHVLPVLFPMAVREVLLGPLKAESQEDHYRRNRRSRRTSEVCRAFCDE